jgi:hypothetical protein
MERVELTLLRLESVIKDRGRDDDVGGSALWPQEEDESVSGMSQGGSTAAAKKISTKRNSVAPI